MQPPGRPAGVVGVMVERSARAVSSVLIDGRPLRRPLSGIGQYVRHLTAGLLRESDARIGLLEFDFLNRDRDFRDALEIDRSRISTRPHALLHRKVFNALAAYTRLPVGELLGLGGYDVLHETYFELLPRTRAPTPGRTVEVATIHDVGFLRHPELFDPRNLAAAERAFAVQIDRCEVLFTPSRFTADELVELAGVEPRRIVVTPLAPTTAALGTASRREPGAGDTRPFALYLGNIDPRKNVRSIVDAWISEGLGRDYDLVLAGSPLRGNLAYAAQLSQLSSFGIRYLGYVDDGERARLFQHASCFVYPSSYEGFGLPVLEAMLAGAPVVISDAPALVEVAGAAAQIVPRTALDGLGAAVRRVLDDQDLQTSLAARGRIRAAEFDWSSTARATLRGYERAAALR
jgi:glycosyltransferase involved in cell wall biosynthesis